MDKTNQLLDFCQIDDVTNGDPKFRKELMSIFMEQINEFIENMNGFMSVGNMERLAREAHTAKSSVLIFGMESTGHMLKEIQLLAEQNRSGEIPYLLQQVEADMKEAYTQLEELIRES